MYKNIIKDIVRFWIEWYFIDFVWWLMKEIENRRSMEDEMEEMIGENFDDWGSDECEDDELWIDILDNEMSDLEFDVEFEEEIWIYM